MALRRFVLCLVGIVLLAGCPGPRNAADWQELAGARAAPAVERRFGGVVRDAVAEARMQRVGERLAAAVPALRGRYTFRLLACAEPNAVSLPTGRIYVTRGLYRQLGRDDWLAAVVAHEMAHLVAQDHFKPRCGTDESALQRELSADAMAVRYLAAVGVEASAMVAVIELVAPQQPAGWSGRRIAALADTISAPVMSAR